MIKQTMHLSGSSRSNWQVQAALNAVTDITKESVWFIIIYCFFTVGTVKFLQLHSVTQNLSLGYKYYFLLYYHLNQ